MSTPQPKSSELSEDPSEILNLWPIVPGTALDAHDLISDRETNGHHDRLIRGIINPTLRVYTPKTPDPNRSACIIGPGGGYGFLAVDKEGDDVARLLAQNGVTAFVLVYRLPDGDPPAAGTLPVPIADAARAVRMVRSQASRLNIDPHRIGIMGFSAGGHVAAVTATRFDAGNASDPDPIQRQSSRPDFAVLLYPVISMHDPIAHVGSRNNLLGKQASVELVNRYSADQNVTPQTPPLFICHAQDDTPVPVQNSLQMATAAGRARVPYELVLLKTGGHGFGLGIDGGEPTIWPGRLLHWMHIQHLLSAPAASH